MIERIFTISFLNIRRSKIDQIWYDAVDRVQPNQERETDLLLLCRYMAICQCIVSK